MPLGKEVALGPGHIVLDGDPMGTQPPTAAPPHFLGHRLGDDLIDLLFEVVSVRPSVRPQKVFSDFHVIWCVGRP